MKKRLDHLYQFGVRYLQLFLSLKQSIFNRIYLIYVSIFLVACCNPYYFTVYQKGTSSFVDLALEVLGFIFLKLLYCKSAICKSCKKCISLGADADNYHHSSLFEFSLWFYVHTRNLGLHISDV